VTLGGLNAGMSRQTVCILLPERDRVRLKAIIGDRSRPFKHVQRAQIVLASDRQPRVLKVWSSPAFVDTLPLRGECCDAENEKSEVVLTCLDSSDHS